MREVKAKIRTWHAQTNKIHGVKIGSDHVLVPWMVKWAAAMYNRTHRDANGRTPYELRYGRSFRK